MSSIARKFGKAFGVMLFTLFLSLAMLSYSLAEFTKYGAIEPAFEQMVLEKMPVNKADLEGQRKTVLDYCKQPGITEMPIQEGVALQCADVSASTADQLPKLMAKAYFDSIYYKPFSCSFVKCMITLPSDERSSIILTDMGNRFYSKAWIYLLAAAIGAAALLFICSNTWASRLKSLGFCMFIAGTPYFMFSFLKKFLPADVASQASPLIDVIVKTLSPKFLIVLITGVILIIAGFGMKYIFKKEEQT